ncbi:hypothetical protein COO03_04985 [Bacillus sp. AFS098217]|uniref:hypothetical protein n=1 Tax=Bacillus sp. AFS098217 TaxID=2033868 RepID=UPI000BEBB7F2|nr:hypothetical protein [Bacillus sp. AFS098217]PEB54597.1 hypothetical protein COO03_04985 [Bacillus sp. AFS098217]
MTKIRVTFHLSSGEKRGTIVEVKNIEDAQLKIRNNFVTHKLSGNVLYEDADYPESGNTFEIFENHVVCIDYEKAE